MHPDLPRSASEGRKLAAATAKLSHPLAVFKRRYAAGLRSYLLRETSPRAATQVQLRLGQRAARLGIGVLEVARMHERCLQQLPGLRGRSVVQERAGLFFRDVIRPLLARVAVISRSRLATSRLELRLKRRNAELESTRARLQRSVLVRQRLQATLKRSGDQNSRLLAQSLRMQEVFRQTTRRVLIRMEEERGKVSRQLHDDVAQTLLGINVRLISMRKDASDQSRWFRTRMASTRRLVGQSAKSMKSMALRLSKK